MAFVCESFDVVVHDVISDQAFKLETADAVIAVPVIPEEQLVNQDFRGRFLA